MVTHARVVFAAKMKEYSGVVKGRISFLETQNSNIAKYNRELREDESLVVPIISFGVEQEPKELMGRIVKNGRWSVLPIKGARQVRFRLDERGTLLKSDSFLAMASEPPPPRHFVFYKPFLIFIKEIGRESPYFAVWIDNAELIEPSS